MSFCVADVHVNFGLPIPLAWLRLISSHVLTGVLRGLRCTWPNQLTRFSLIFSFLLHQNFWIREIIIKIRNFRFAGCELWHKNNSSSARSVFLMVKPWTNSIACYNRFQEEWKKKEKGSIFFPIKKSTSVSFQNKGNLSVSIFLQKLFAADLNRQHSEKENSDKETKEPKFAA